MFKAYASYFVSYLLANLRNADGIDKIILFGSVARDEATKDSDIDIFIEINKNTKKLTKEIETTLDGFYGSREALFFKAKGIDNKINLIIGKLDDWKNVKDNIEGTGIMLYGRFLPQGIKGKKYSLIYWEKIERNRGAFLNKIYGVKIKGKYYKGLMEKGGGRKIGKSAIMVPIDKREEIIRLLKYHKVNSRIVDVYA